jgi:hypothetical protein
MVVSIDHSRFEKPPRVRAFLRLTVNRWRRRRANS